MRRLVLVVVVALIAWPASAAKRLTVLQLEQALTAASAANKPDAQIARQIAGMELSERLTEATLERLTARLTADSQAILALRLLADQSAFLDPPASELPPDPAPDDLTQQRMLERARNYVAQTLPHLPNLLATQTTDRYDDSPKETKKGGWPIRAGLHLVDSSSHDTSVLNEQTNVPRTSGSAVWQAQGGLISGGEFGSTLGMILADTLRGKLAWSHWEQLAAGRAAVFRYSVPKSASHFEIISTLQRQAALEGVSAPIGTTRVSGIEVKPSDNSLNTSTFLSRPGYHGSLWLDPATGSILGIAVETGSKEGAPFPSAAILVQYGPVEIGGSKFICPVRSLALSTADAGANLDPLTRLPGDAPTKWVNESAFTGYRRFGATARIVTNGSDSPQRAETGSGGVRQGVHEAEVPQTSSVKQDETASAAGVSEKTRAESTPAPTSSDVDSSAASTVSAAAAPTATTSATAASTSTVSGPVVSSPAASAAPPANEPQPIEHAIQVNVERVLVPVVARDKNGLFVGSLKKEDFQIFDDGKPRTISNFTVEKRATAMPVEKSRQPANTAIPVAQPSAIPARIIVLLFDDLHLSFEDIAHVQKAGVSALDALSNADMAAVITTSGTNSGLTRDHQKLQDAIMKVKPVGLYHSSTSDCPNIGYYQANLIENRRDSTATAEAIEQVFNCDPALDRLRDQELAARMVATAASHVLAIDRQDVEVTLSTVREIVRRMSALPGERMLVLISPGFLTIEPDALTVESQIIDLAAQSNVTVSALDVRGVSTASIRASEHIAGGPGVVQYQSEMKRSSMSSEENPLSEFANGTGGTFFHNSNDLDKGFRQLTEAPDYVYLLEFSLADEKPDGHYHRLKVAVDREGLELQARQGYFMQKPDKKK